METTVSWHDVSVDRCVWLDVPVCVDGVDNQWQTVKEVWLDHSHLVQRGERLSEEEARRALEHICPSAEVYIIDYQVRLVQV